MREKVLTEVKRWQDSGYVDWISLSSNLLFTMKCVHNFEELRKETFYNRMRLDGYNAEGYLEGVEVVSMDYRQLFSAFKEAPNVVFIIDPTYLGTDCHTYAGGSSWKLSDFLGVLECLQGTNFVYFTSNRSSIVELADWLGHHQLFGNPFDGADMRVVRVSGKVLNYDDVMLVKTAS